MRLNRHRLLGLVLDVDLEVILQVFTDAWHVCNHGNSEGLQVLAITDARQLQQLRAVERTPAQTPLSRPSIIDTPRPKKPPIAKLADLDTGSSLWLLRVTEHHLVDLGPRHQGQIRAVKHRMEVGARSAETATA